MLLSKGRLIQCCQIYQKFNWRNIDSKWLEIGIKKLHIQKCRFSKTPADFSLVILIRFGTFWTAYYAKLASYTGCSVWKITKVKGCSSETENFWPYVVKAKMCLRGCSLFDNQLKNCKHIFENWKNLFSIYRLSNVFWLYQHRVKILFL